MRENERNPQKGTYDAYLPLKKDPRAVRPYLSSEISLPKKCVVYVEAIIFYINFAGIYN
jgi:hypothetical protein